MSIATVVTRGYGTFGSIGKVVTAGFMTSATVKATLVTRGYGTSGSIGLVVLAGYFGAASAVASSYGAMKKWLRHRGGNNGLL